MKQLTSGKHWVHPQYQIAERCPTSTKPQHRPLDTLTIFLFLSSISFTFTICVLVYPLRRASMPEIIQSAISAFNGTSYDRSRSKEEFLASLSLDQRKQLASQVHYVVELIRSNSLARSEARELATAIVEESFKAQYDPLFVASVISSESTFNRHAISYAGAKGLMQILPGTAKYISEKNSFDWKGDHKLSSPEYNIQLGIAYLKELEKNYKGNLEHALIAYNWGPTNLSSAFKGTKTIPSSSMRYAKSIIARHGRWKKEFDTRRHQFQYFGVDFSV